MVASVQKGGGLAWVPTGAPRWHSRQTTHGLATPPTHISSDLCVFLLSF